MRAHRIESKEIEYVAPGIPARMITVVSGRPGEGKSTWTTLLAAEVSKHSPVIYSNQEDALHETIRPRLEAAGADLRRIIIPPVPFLLPNDVERLERLVQLSGAKLIVMDSANQHLNVASASGQQVRKALTPLRAMLERTGAAAVFVDHLVKNVKKNAHPLEALSGAGSGLPAAARFVYVFGRNPNDPDERVLAPVKVNATDAQFSFAYEMDGAEVFTADGAQIDCGRLLLVNDKCEVDASEVLSFNGGGKATGGDDDGNSVGLKAAIATEWLTGVLMFGVRKADDVKTEGSGAGFSWRTLQRAAKNENIVRSRVGFGKGSYVTWALPPTHPALTVAAQMGGAPIASTAP